MARNGAIFFFEVFLFLSVFLSFFRFFFNLLEETRRPTSASTAAPALGRRWSSAAPRPAAKRPASWNLERKENHLPNLGSLTGPPGQDQQPIRSRFSLGPLESFDRRREKARKKNSKTKTIHDDSLFD